MYHGRKRALSDAEREPVPVQAIMDKMMAVDVGRYALNVRTER